MNFLQHILAGKREEVAQRRKTRPIELLRESQLYSRTPLSLADALRRGKPGIIAEVKKASPSKGLLRQDFNPFDIARAYAAAGAHALSILTDAPAFQGDIATIVRVRPEISLPILRKDFIIDSYQIHESRSIGADALLLIAAAMDAPRLQDLYEETRGLGMEVLVEVHTGAELERVSVFRPEIIGINNRDLESFQTDIGTTERLVGEVPDGSIVLSESGIQNAADARRLLKCGVDGFLIGEAFIRAAEPGRALAEFLRGVAS